MNNTLIKTAFYCLLALAALPLAGAAGSRTDQVEAILQRDCVACHRGAKARADLRLESGEWLAALVNVPAKEKPELKLVDPRQPEKSYLLRKLAGDDSDGARMPLGAEPLSAADQQSIRSWVLSLGADPPAASTAAPDAAPGRPVFWGSRLINLPTTRVLGSRRWQFMVAHRFFLPLSSGYDSFYGLNGPAAVLVSISYGLSERLQVMFGHTNSDHQFDLAGRWLLLPGRKGVKHPLALALQAGAGLATSNLPGEGTFDSRHFKINLQAPLSYRFSSRLSLLLVPSYSTHVDAHNAESGAVMALGTGFKFTIFDELAIVGQWLPVLDGPRAAANGWGAGLEYKTGGHVFQIFFLNASGLLADQYLPGGDLLLKEGDFRIGFNLIRNF
jgi:mono/diheme cytochrome c family protein